jgi:mevalonate kinase
MKLKDLVLLAGAYIAGNAVASVYNSKKGDAVKKEIVDDKDNALKIVWNNVVDINKKMFNDVKEEVKTLDTEEMKTKLIDLAEEFKEKAQELIKEFNKLKGKGPEYASEIYKKLEDLYNEKKEMLESYKEEIPAFVSESKDKLLEYFEETKKEIKK